MNTDDTGVSRIVTGEGNNPVMGVLPLRNSVLYPDLVMPLAVGRKKSIQLIEEAIEEDRQLLICSQRHPETNDPEPEELYHTGTLAQIIKVIKTGDEGLNVIVQGLMRVTIVEFVQTDPFLAAGPDVERARR